MGLVEPKKSPVIVGLARDSLATCLERMEAAGVGAILIVDRENRLEAILTERDLVKRWRMMADPEFLKKPVGTIATRPVFTLTIETIGQAPREMVKRRIRHVPLVDGEGRVIGLVSMRDVMDGLLTHGTLPRMVVEPATAKLPPGTMHLLTPTGQVAELCRRFLPPNWSTKTWLSVRSILNLQELKEPPLLRQAAFLLDLDGVGGGGWRELIKRFIGLLKGTEQPAIFIVSSPAALSERDFKTLKAVGDKANWHVYHRPIQVASFTEDLRRLNDELKIMPAST